MHQHFLLARASHLFICLTTRLTRLILYYGAMHTLIATQFHPQHRRSHRIDRARCQPAIKQLWFGHPVNREDPSRYPFTFFAQLRSKIDLLPSHSHSFCIPSITCHDCCQRSSSPAGHLGTHPRNVFGSHVGNGRGGKLLTDEISFPSALPFNSIEHHMFLGISCH